MVRTSVPTSSTTPIASWPIGRPVSVGSRSAYGHRSLPQIKALVMRTIASVGSTMGADSPTFRRRGAAFRPDPPVGIVPAMPSPPPSRPHLAARARRWGASHPRTAILGWIALVVAPVVLGQAVGFRTAGEDGDGESGRAQVVLDRHFPPSAPEETVLVSSATHRVHDAAFRDTVADAVRRLKAADHVKKVDVGAASADRH